MVIHISTVNILKMVRDAKNITIAIKQDIMYGLLIGIFRFELR